jgi:hypothetical protein
MQTEFGDLIQYYGFEDSFLHVNQLLVIFLLNSRVFNV